MSEKLEIFRKKMDADTGLASKRKFLLTVSLALLALNLSGAKIKEANTFLFKIEFDNHEGLIGLLFISIIFLMLRYYSYSVKYHSQLFDLWSSRMLNDPMLFRHEN